MYGAPTSSWRRPSAAVPLRSCAATANGSPWSGDGGRDSWPRVSTGSPATRRASRASNRFPPPSCSGGRSDARPATGRCNQLAKAAGVSLRSVQRILEAHRLAPHRVRTFKLSTDPKFAAKLTDIVGLYVDPPAHAVFQSVEEKGQIQALDRTQPGLPMKPGRAGTMTHD